MKSNSFAHSTRIAGLAVTLTFASLSGATAQTMSDANLNYFPGAELMSAVHNKCKAGNAATPCVRAVGDLSNFVLSSFQQMIGTGSPTSGGRIAVGTTDNVMFIEMPTGLAFKWSTQTARANAACKFLSNVEQMPTQEALSASLACIDTIIHDTEVLSGATGGNTTFAQMARTTIEEVDGTKLTGLVSAPSKMAGLQPGANAPLGYAGIPSLIDRPKGP